MVDRDDDADNPARLFRDQKPDDLITDERFNQHIQEVENEIAAWEMVNAG